MTRALLVVAKHLGLREPVQTSYLWRSLMAEMYPNWACTGLADKIAMKMNEMAVIVRIFRTPVLQMTNCTCN